MTLNSVNYQLGNGANHRYITGNSTTHEFLLNYRSDEISGGYYRAVRGTGISQGAGNYYLFQVQAKGLVDSATNTALDGTQTLSYCFSAETGKIAADATNCDQYKTKLESTAFFTTAQLPAAATDVVIPTY